MGDAPGGPAEGPADPLIRTLFEASNDPQYVLDYSGQRFLVVNPAFEALTGYTRHELLAEGFRIIDLVAKESKPLFEEKRAERVRRERERYELRLQCKGGTVKPCEISVTRIERDGRLLVIGSLKDLTETKRLQRETWARIEELGFANNRIYALTERLRRVPDMLAALLNLSDEGSVLETATAKMTARDGLAYERVRWYVERAGALELVHASDGPKRRRIQVDRDHLYVQIWRGGSPPEITARQAILPLRGRERTAGLLEVRFQPKEIEGLKGNDRALQGYFDLAVTLAGAIGVILENLRLTDAIRQQAVTDQLTGVFNRRMMSTRLVEEVSRCMRYRRDLAVLMLDLDRFKPINDTMGHRQGDAVLEQIGKLLKMLTREADTVCRYGGDEFAVLLPETSHEDAMKKAEALRAAVHEMEFPAVQRGNPPVRVTASIGVASFGPGAEGPEEILRVADEALYEAKRLGKDRVQSGLPGRVSPPVEQRG